MPRTLPFAPSDSGQGRQYSYEDYLNEALPEEDNSSFSPAMLKGLKDLSRRQDRHVNTLSQGDGGHPPPVGNSGIERSFEFRQPRSPNAMFSGDDNDDAPSDSADEIDLSNVSGQRTQQHFSSRLVIAIDYGTTFTGVAFATPRSDRAILSDVQIVDNWGSKMDNQVKIPSVYSYSPSTLAGERQWGADISPDAVTMVNTKLELDFMDSKKEELEVILQLLNGTCDLDFDNVKESLRHPGYTWKTPEEIVTDYLTKVFEHIYRALPDVGAHLWSQLPVDMVITVPVNWSYRAKNSTYKAVKNAGFNKKTFPNLKDIILVTEPEAAALYTARHLKEDKSIEFLKLGEHFVLCDAGGGTVDVVSYQVIRLEPTLELRKVTVATSGKCGSTFIDAEFKRWLRKIMGEEHYRMLSPNSAGQQISAHTTESRQMRDVIKAFEVHKKSFSNKNMAFKMDLPSKNLHVPGVIQDGQLTITRSTMAKLFNPCINKIIELIQGQINQVEGRHHSVKNVFLVGGFGESRYLQDELVKSLVLRRITMRRPEQDQSWTAVVRGATIYGIEKAHFKSKILTSSCPRSFAIVLDEQYSGHRSDHRDWYASSVTNMAMAKMQITWLVRKGELLLKDEKRELIKEFTFYFAETGRRTFEFPVFMYKHDNDDDVPMRFETGQHDLKPVGAITCDLSRFSITKFDRFRSGDKRSHYYGAPMVCKTILSSDMLEVELSWRNEWVGRTKITNLEGERPSNGQRLSRPHRPAPQNDVRPLIR